MNKCSMKDETSFLAKPIVLDIANLLRRAKLISEYSYRFNEQFPVPTIVLNLEDVKIKRILKKSPADFIC